MERVLRDKQIFGGILGEVLYEVFRSQRRLRDDLYYRLIRGGEIQLPELRDRQEDIPILFHFIIATELQSLIPGGLGEKWEVELPVYEALMDPPREWQGNLRELQSIARMIVARAVEDFEARGSEEEVFKITRMHARKVLAAHREGPNVYQASADVPNLGSS
jgi:DNA-binding NtrC family response regulator